MPVNRRSFAAALGAFARAARLRCTALAQVWPERPIRLIVPFPPGGGAGVISRQRAERTDRLTLDCNEPFPSSVAAFAAFMRAGQAKWAAIVRDIGIRID